MRFHRRFVSVLSLCVLLSGCTGRSGSPREVHLWIWSNYVTPETLGEFEKKTGIKVVVSNFSSNEELLAKMQAGGTGFDVVVPSDYMVAGMTKLRLLTALDLSKISSAKALDPRFLRKAFDPKNEYSLPFDWGTTGIAINRKLYSGSVTGWNDLFTKPELSGKIALLDDVREVIGAALKAQGHSLNSKNPADLDQAKKLLLAARKRVKLYSSESLMTLMNSEAAVTHAYVSDAMQARARTDGKVDYVLPVEGGTLWIDNLVIPASAEHVEEAYALINFLLEPKTVAATVQAVFVSPTSQGAISLLPPSVLANRSMFPTEAELGKFEMLEDLGSSMQAWDKVWTELKASGD